MDLLSTKNIEKYKQDVINMTKEYTGHFTETINKNIDNIKNELNFNPASLLTFKNRNSYEKRCEHSNKLLIKYPNFVPVIVDSLDFSVRIDKNKLLIHKDTSCTILIYNIRKQLKLENFESIFVFCNDILVCNTYTVGQLYEYYLSENKIQHDGDKFLYLEIKKENTFG
jgi:hypothetical protein